ncbi:NADH-quinone oxidoreductase subunit M [Bradymonadaceae bacterium TMQ3]|uniref:NADH-quinone oxidoreductase subunit M n=1 Tax=Lujinxingia sediminis TaxID=2480984 RepID=A0ABY0CXF1_9DELT|nr:NADH-quinone oxidoreductase subunit M [Lujinxingia sediminis]RDV39581.1 NADH-quinone oxidoreductase subunit M [Bradymonadaceae bacterium TMQ3]RVU48374.1 NADH-quinone oxidoreductase subunit M [Lujinxingia sediminis]TXC77676.1 NADH-quinone oxidoreductase subunit M [Bradymonadales bacterium TMQ1]
MVQLTNIFGALVGNPLLAQAAAVSEGGIPWLTLTTFGPLLGILALLLIPREQVQVLRNVALLTSLGVFAVSIGILVLFDPSLPMAAGEAFTFQLTEGPYEWIPSLGVSYALGVDGFSYWLVMLTTFLMPLAIWSTYSSVHENVKEYMICLLFLEVGMIGALVATDVFLFYIFWEVMLIPMYFIIGVWGGADRVKAAATFFIYTMLGSILMLLAIMYVYFQAGVQTGTFSFLYTDILAADFSATEQFWLFAAFFLAFAIKVPLFPFHTWLPLAHVQAPTAGSVILAAVMLKMGTYGILRYAFPLFPDALKTFAPYIAVLSVIGIIYGAIVALVQDDVKKLVAYSSVSHLGFCVLGLVAMTPQGISGAMYVMLAHGIATGGLFLCVGVLYERRHSRQIADFGGVASVMPMFATFFMVITFASAGLPGLNGFVGEFLSIMGTSQSHFLWFETPFGFIKPENAGSGYGVYELSAMTDVAIGSARQAGPEITAFIFTIFATSGVILGAAYLLWMFKRVMFGSVVHDEIRTMPRLSAREIGVLVPIVLMAIFMGVFPKYFLSRMDPSIHQFLTYMDQNVTEANTVVVEPLDPTWVPQGSMIDLAKERRNER